MSALHLVESEWIENPMTDIDASERLKRETVFFLYRTSEKLSDINEKIRTKLPDIAIEIDIYINTLLDFAGQQHSNRNRESSLDVIFFFNEMAEKLKNIASELKSCNTPKIVKPVNDIVKSLLDAIEARLKYYQNQLKKLRKYISAL